MSKKLTKESKESLRTNYTWEDMEQIIELKAMHKTAIIYYLISRCGNVKRFIEITGVNKSTAYAWSCGDREPSDTTLKLLIETLKNKTIL